MKKDNNLKESFDQKQEIDDRINRLYGLSSEPIKEVKQLSREESIAIRKKMLILFIATLLVILIIGFMLFKPFDIVENNNQYKPVQTPGNNDKEEQLLPGEISITDEQVVKLNNLVSVSALDLYYVDLFELFKYESITTKAMSSEMKVHILSKSELFTELIDKYAIKEYMKSCDVNGVQITNQDFDSALHKALGPNISIENGLSKNIYFVQNLNVYDMHLNKTNDKYLLDCNVKSLDADITKYPHQKLYKAVSKDNTIELYYKVVFIDDNNVYSDYNFSNLITNDKTENYESYIKKGSTYKYTFIKDEEESYYLFSIDKVTGDDEYD